MENIHVDLDNSANYKIKEPTCHFSGKVKHENFIPESSKEANCLGLFDTHHSQTH